MTRTLDIAVATVNKLQARGGTWGIYERSDIGHPAAGHLKFLRYGADSTFAEPPERLPDTKNDINWAYRLVAKVAARDIPADGLLKINVSP